MKNSRLRLKNWLMVIFCLFAFHNLASAQQLAMPQYEVTDKFGVSAITGEVTSGAATLSIGGAMGLSHKIFSHSNNFLMRTSDGAVRGVYDNYNGSATYTLLVPAGQGFNNSTNWTNYRSNNYATTVDPLFYDIDVSASGNITPATTTNSQGVWVMRVTDGTDSAEFKVMLNVGSTAYAICYTTLSSGYFFEALRNLGHTLVIPTDKPNYLLWTKPDGTQVYFYRGSAAASASGFLSEIIYPTGLTLSFSRPSIGAGVLGSISTNTGFLLKYNYSLVGAASLNIGAQYSSPLIPAEDQSGWNRRNPKSIVGVNQAFEYCNPNDNSPCVGAQEPCPEIGVGQQNCTMLTKKWPIAKFIWPVQGMPRAFFFGDNKFTLIDSAQRTTDFNVKSVDAYSDGSGGSISESYQLNTVYAPRLMSVKPAGSTTATVNYQYMNDFQYVDRDFLVYSIPKNTSSLISASGIRGVGGIYGTLPEDPVTHISGRSVTDIQVRFYERLFKSIAFVQTKENKLTFFLGYRSLPYQRIDLAGKILETYGYDNRSNLTSIIYNEGSATQTQVQAIFPTSCTSQTLKTCNKPTEVIDAKGNKTIYSYHQDSGQTETITQPANKNNVVTKTIFTYEQKYAKYIQSANGSKTNAPTPIWMKTVEKSCLTSSYASCGTGSSDEVLTKYEYNDNLLVKGITVTAADSSGSVTTKRTCYQYDIYGNRIGEIQPKAYVASCN